MTWQVDALRTATLYAPMQLLLSLIYIGLVYEIPFLDVNPVLSLLVGAAPISWIAKQVTENVILKDPFVASGPCPNCGTENRIYFGDVLGVVGDRDESSVKCTNCKSSLTVKRSTLRVSTLLVSLHFS